MQLNKTFTIITTSFSSVVNSKMLAHHRWICIIKPNLPEFSNSSSKVDHKWVFASSLHDLKPSCQYCNESVVWNLCISTFSSMQSPTVTLKWQSSNFSQQILHHELGEEEKQCSKWSQISFMLASWKASFVKQSRLQWYKPSEIRPRHKLLKKTPTCLNFQWKLLLTNKKWPSFC